MKSKFLLLLFCCVSYFVNAQTFPISGSIHDDNNIPLPGVSILVKGSTNGTTTDFDGNFTIPNIASGDILIISYLGFVTQEIIVSSPNPLNVQLEADLQALDEVLVIGYGTQKVSKISGSVAVVNAKSIETLQPVRAEDALQGQAAGVNVIANGSPGTKPTVLIRGIPSYTGTDPLVVIDGVQQTLDDLNALNPGDIKSMNVLKDAALSAIYGVSGGNGVILVQTKSGGRNNKTVFSFDASTGIQEVANTIDVLNASEYVSILNEASSNAGEGLIFDDISSYGRGTDWQDQVFVEAPITNFNLTASGGSENTSYFISAGHLAQEGVVGGEDKSYFDRTTLTANFNTNLTDKLVAIINTSYANIKSSSLSENNINSVLSNAINFDPTVSPYDANGNFGTSTNITQEIKNPLALIDNSYNKNNTNKLYGKLELQYDVLDNFKITSRFGYNYVDIYGKDFTPLVFYGVGHNNTTANEDLSPIVTVSPDGEETSTHNRVSESRTNYFRFSYELFGNYDFKIGEDHSFETVAGLTIAKNQGSNVTANAQDIPFNSWNYADVSAATGDLESQTSGSWQYVKRNVSYFGRMNYDFKERYLLSASARVDGSTSFGKNNKFGVFYAGSLGWVISNEAFWNSETINYLKLRSSYGTVGNDNIDPQFATISTFPKYTFDGNIITGSTLQSIPNDDVTWETQTQFDAGLDVKFFESRLSLTAEYWQKTVDDLLFSPTLSLYLGTPDYPAANIGKTKSSGFDFSIGYSDTSSGGFRFSTSVNLTTATNEVEEINNGDKFIWGSGYGIPYTNLTRFEEGYSPGYFYGYKTDGIFQNQAEIDAHATQDGAQPGDIRYQDLNNDGVINADDRGEIGDPFADYNIGWNLAFDYKNFDFMVFTYASVGGDIYRAYERNSNYTNRFASTLDRWTGEGTSTTEPRVTFVDTNNNIRPSDRYVEDGSFVRIKNIQLGYTLPDSFNTATGMSRVRVYAQVKNALTFTDYSGYDPEISSGVLDTGVDRGNYPQPRTWLIGVNVKF
ncbi:SusC/RagA family TonB-linked outer membrane protein [Formosa sp. A9]|uniref:SusC/RagA family TonB-linked outer membrane protein n=1 Tax=Formosa sp. A9 TaxID=3442641 RepID=UPI003EB91354